MKILVLDGAQRSTLAATRSLGRSGHRVLVADESAASLAAASRYCAGSLSYPSPYRAPGAFLDWFGERAAQREFDVALPMTEVTTDLLVRHRESWPHIALPFAPITTIDALTDKISLYTRARGLGVPVPESVIVSNQDQLGAAVERIGFPAVLKPRRSRLWTGHGFHSTGVRRVAGRGELEACLALPEFRDEPFLYQRLVPGEGQGVFALYRSGEPVAFFAHRRLREKPPEGGVSVLSECCHPDPVLLQHARRLLDDADWHGVAMVEFKVSEAEGPYLMEVNARFWGSLQLAIDAGVDFPRLLVESESAGEFFPPSIQCLPGRRLRWFLGDLDRLYLIMKQAGRRRTGDVFREVGSFLRPDFGRTRHEVFRWNDPAPAFRETAQYLRALLRG